MARLEAASDATPEQLSDNSMIDERYDNMESLMTYVQYFDRKKMFNVASNRMK